MANLQKFRCFYDEDGHLTIDIVTGETVLCIVMDETPNFGLIHDDRTTDKPICFDGKIEDLTEEMIDLLVRDE